MQLFRLHVCLYTKCMPGACESQARALDPGAGVSDELLCGYWGLNPSPLEGQAVRLLSHCSSPLDFLF